MPYDKVRFLGFRVCTAPKNTNKVFTQDKKAYWLSGDYTGVPGEAAANDIKARIGIMKSAVEKAKAASDKAAKDEKVTDADTLKVFMAPEFFFRGTNGAYELEDDEYHKVISELRGLANNAAYRDWVFCFGTVLAYSRTADEKDVLASLKNLWKTVVAKDAKLAKIAPPDGAYKSLADYRKAVPKEAKNIKSNLVPPAENTLELEGYNVAFVQRGAKGEPESRAIMKEFKSMIDFTVWASTNVIEPGSIVWQKVDHIPRIGPGETEVKNYDGTGVFSFKTDADANLKKAVFGVEVCLDHNADGGRLKKANANVDIHLVTSCGMGLIDARVVAKADGFAFNVDGHDAGGRSALWKMKKGGKDVIKAVSVAGPNLGAYYTGGSFIDLYPAQDFKV